MKPLIGVIYDFDNDHLYSGNIIEGISEMNDLSIRVSNKSERSESILITGTADIFNYRENFQVDVVFSNSKVE